MLDEELISGYFRPVTSFIGIRDKSEDRYFGVLPDRPQAGTSRLPSQIEMIIERKSISSDFKGVNEITYDDYDGMWLYKLCFFKGKNEERIRHSQQLNEVDVLKVITASTLTDDQIKIDASQPIYNSSPFDSKCIRPDLQLQTEEEPDNSPFLLLRITNYCPTIYEKTSLGQILENLNVPLELINKVNRKTIDGVHPFFDPKLEKNTRRNNSSKKR